METAGPPAAEIIMYKHPSPKKRQYKIYSLTVITSTSNHREKIRHSLSGIVFFHLDVLSN
jgi:hypothetical protein